MTIPRACIKCGQPSVPGTSRCRDHLGKSGWARYVADYPDRAAFYKSGGWRAAREAQLRREPNCRICGKPAVVADHVRPRGEGGPDLDPGNLQSLCQAHHDQKTRGESKRGRKRAAGRHRGQ